MLVTPGVVANTVFMYILQKWFWDKGGKGGKDGKYRDDVIDDT